MAYADRTAVTGAPIDLTFVKVIDLPALPQGQFSNTRPIFLAGTTRQVSQTPDTICSNMPCLWADSYDSDIPTFTGLLAMGVAHADYALREAGTGASDEYSEYFEKQGYIDRLYVGMNQTFTPAGFGYSDPTIDLEFQRQVLGDFTGGAASPVSANATETQSVTFEDYLNSASVSYIGASLASTTDAPEALFIFNPQYADGPDLTPSTEDQDRIGAFKVGATGAIELVSLFRTDEVAYPDQGGNWTVWAQCRDDVHHYFIRGGASASVVSYTSCVESSWGTYTYANYTPQFDDPDLPAGLGALLSGADANYRYLTIYGTDAGFLISYLKLNVDTWEPKFILVDREWTTVQHIVATAGDATAATILAQGVLISPPDEGWFAEAAISMMTDSGYVWMIGGTPDVPLIVEARFDVPEDTTYCIPFIVGHGYCSRAQILRPATAQEGMAQSGPILGKLRRTTYAAPLLADTQGMSMGVDFLQMRPLAFKSPGGTVDLSPQETFSGVYWGTVDADSNYDNMWCWEVCRPYPCTVVAVEIQHKTNENT